MNFRSLAASTLILTTGLMLGCQSTGPKQAPKAAGASTNVVERGGKLYRAVEEHVRSQGSVLTEIPHQLAYTDLNGDGLVDVLLMLSAPEWCIGESCTLMIFEGIDSGARPLAELTLISSPVSVGEAAPSGWRDVFVTLPGSAGKSTMAQIRHDGTLYPESPSDWRFLADGASLPGRPVLVGGGVEGEDLAGFQRLLAQMEQGNASASVSTAAATPVSDDDQKFYGRYSWGPGEAYFRPCGGSSVYWVSSSEGVAAELDAQYREIAFQQFDDVYLEMEGASLPAPSEGEASFYDGVMEIEQLIKMEPVDDDTCSAAPAS